MEKLDVEKIKKEFSELTEELGKPEVIKDASKLKEISKARAKLEKLIEKSEKSEKLEKEISETEKLAASGQDEELINLASLELKKLKKEKAKLDEEIGILSGGNADLSKSVIVEIRAGTGGEEAALFASELFNMYVHYAANNNWKVNILDSSKTDLGGCKSAVFEINGENIYSTMRFESGVHRVQRVPATEKSGRIHTSTVSVAVLPQAEEVDVEIKPQDIKIEFFRSSGPGGQNVNKVETAVRIYHLPSGIAVASQESRSQLKNREAAMKMLRSKLYEIKKIEEEKKMSAERKKQIGTAERSEKIRTYNFPQDRITDHRIKESWKHIAGILAGGLEPVIETLKEHLGKSS